MRQMSFRAMLRKEIGWFDLEKNASGIIDNHDPLLLILFTD
jgi:hypothetical protein